MGGLRRSGVYDKSMPILSGITASPTTVQPGGSSTITVTATADAPASDSTYRIDGVVVGTSQKASVTVVLAGAPATPLRFVTDVASAKPGDILVTAPDGGALTPTTTPGVYTFKP